MATELPITQSEARFRDAVQMQSGSLSMYTITMKTPTGWEHMRWPGKVVSVADPSTGTKLRKGAYYRVLKAVADTDTDAQKQLKTRADWSSFGYKNFKDFTQKGIARDQTYIHRVEVYDPNGNFKKGTFTATDNTNNPIGSEIEFAPVYLTDPDDATTDAAVVGAEVQYSTIEYALEQIVHPLMEYGVLGWIGDVDVALNDTEGSVRIALQNSNPHLPNNDAKGATALLAILNRSIIPLNMDRGSPSGVADNATNHFEVVPFIF